MRELLEEGGQARRLRFATLAGTSLDLLETNHVSTSERSFADGQLTFTFQGSPRRSVHWRGRHLEAASITTQASRWGEARRVARGTRQTFVTLTRSGAGPRTDPGRGLGDRGTDATSVLNVGKHLLSGFFSAVVSKTCVAPLERVKMEVVLNSKYLSGAQAATAVLSGEGLLGFWKGNGLNLLRTAPFKAINFFSFDLYHKTLQGSSLNLRGSEVFLAGAMAGVTATVLCFPLDTIRTRMLAPRINQAGLVATVTGMVRREGMASLYAGSLPAVVSMAPAGAVFYGVYNTLKQQHQQRAALQQAQSGTARCASTAGMDGGHDARVEVGVMWGLLYGALAGCASEAVVYPLEVVRRRMQMNGMLVAAAGCGPGLAAGARALHRASSSSRLAMAVQDVMRVRGMRGFYQGVVPNMLQVLPSAALSYQTYELMKELLCVE